VGCVQNLGHASECVRVPVQHFVTPHVLLWIPLFLLSSNAVVILLRSHATPGQAVVDSTLVRSHDALQSTCTT